MGLNGMERWSGVRNKESIEGKESKGRGIYIGMSQLTAIVTHFELCFTIGYFEI